jgi:hypothetical protein
MSKILQLRQAITLALLSAHPRVYFEDAPRDAVFPYVVYSLVNSIDDGSMENFMMDVDGWDNRTDTTQLETIMHAVDQALHRKTIMITSDTSLTMYRENRLVLNDEDERIKRRKYKYQVRTHQA